MTAFLRITRLGMAVEEPVIVAGETAAEWSALLPTAVVFLEMEPVAVATVFTAIIPEVMVVAEGMAAVHLVSLHPSASFPIIGLGLADQEVMAEMVKVVVMEVMADAVQESLLVPPRTAFLSTTVLVLAVTAAAADILATGAKVGTAAECIPVQQLIAPFMATKLVTVDTDGLRARMVVPVMEVMAEGCPRE
ncbi:MAG: hypothetical protein IT583_03465 [Verrucomicrobia bacterium]|nr:hypothetical protein [Verrucomicrobiota bacterium]